MKQHTRIAIEAAVQAGSFIKSHIGKAKTIGYKGEINLVTDVDRKAEKRIIRHLKKHTPSFDILAEESSGKCGNGDCRWVIDPLDGTTNFAHGFPFFCVSIALEEKGRPILGVVYDPMRDELFRAERGHGAFLNKKKMRVSQTAKLKNALLATGFAYDFKKARKSNVENFVHFIVAARAIRRAGSAALDLCYVACGRFDGFWELDLYPWDTAAGRLIVEEAGGTVSRLRGSAYSHYDKEILASNGKIHNAMITVLRNAEKNSIDLNTYARSLS
jgi:myo-inositol-1(or 4)-monophosphatase